MVGRRDVARRSRRGRRPPWGIIGSSTFFLQKILHLRVNVQESCGRPRDLSVTACHRTAPRRPRRRPSAGKVGVTGDARYLSKEHLSVAHFVAGPRSQELRCSGAHCACRVVLRFLISVPCLSQSYRMSPPTSISARRRCRRVEILQELSWSTASKGARVCW